MKSPLPTKIPCPVDKNSLPVRRNSLPGARKFRACGGEFAEETGAPQVVTLGHNEIFPARREFARQRAE